MAIITTNGTLGATAAITNTTLNTIANAATFASGAVDAASLEIISGGSNNGKLGIKNDGVTTAKIDDSSSKTTGVTFAKMQHISTAKVLGRASASEGDVEEAFDFKDEDNMSSNSATALASQQSIKAYVDSFGPNSVTVNKLDSEIITFSTENVLGASVASNTESVTLPNGLIMKFGRVANTTDGNKTVNFITDFPTAVISAQATVNVTGYETISCSIVGTPGVGSMQVGIKDGGNDTGFYWQAIGY